jgi:hypothetical protein
MRDIRTYNNNINIAAEGPIITNRRTLQNKKINLGSLPFHPKDLNLRANKGISATSK